MTIITFPGKDGSARKRVETMDGAGAGPRDVLVIVHRPESNPGRVGQWLLSHGYRLDKRCPRHGCALPETLENHAGVIVFGGPMSANDPDDYIKREIDWLAVPLRENKPFFGICLGAQMLAKHLGARVGFHPEGRVEVGYYPIRPTAAGRALLPWPDQVYHWHCEGFDIPSGAECIARGEAFENQAMRYGRAFGVQFHPEMTLAMIHRWTICAAHRFGQPGARPKAEHIAGHDAHGLRTNAWLSQFMELWLAPQEAAAVYQRDKKPSLGFSLGAGASASLGGGAALGGAAGAVGAPS
jgi:GMP synthase (glutamine-hydrolysing)